MDMPENLVKFKSESKEEEGTDRYEEFRGPDTELNPNDNCTYIGLNDQNYYGNKKIERSNGNEVKNEITNDLTEEVAHVKTECGFRYAVKVHDFRTVPRVQRDTCDSVINVIKAEETSVPAKEEKDAIIWEGRENSSIGTEFMLDTVCYEVSNYQDGVTDIGQESLGRDFSNSDSPCVKVKTEFSSDTEDTKLLNQDDENIDVKNTETDASFGLTSSISTVEELSARIADQEFEEITDADDITSLALTSIKQEEEEENSGATPSDLPEDSSTPVKRRGRKKKISVASESDGKPTVYEFDIGFIIKHGFNEYIRIFKGQKPFQCSMCSFHDTSKYRLWRHYKRHLGKEPVYDCHVCQKAFNSRHSLRIHMEIHKDVKPFMCSVCGKAFHFRGALMRHVDTHKKTRQHPCDICGAILSRRDVLTQHLKTHSNIKPFRCDHCNKRFTRKSLLWSHMHSHNDFKAFSCTECSNEFKSLSSLKRHMRTTHIDKKPLLCNVCKKPFKRSDQLREHARTHTDETPYKCKFCDKSFRHSKTRNNHQNKFHLKYTSFQCRFCTTYVSSNRILQKHFKRYKLPKEVKCKYCHEKFTFECSFRKHMKSHDNEKKEDLFRCQRCKKVLCSKVSLQRHTPVCRKINSKKKVKCRYCGKSYIDGNYFKKHVELHKKQKL